MMGNNFMFDLNNKIIYVLNKIQKRMYSCIDLSQFDGLFLQLESYMFRTFQD